MSSINRMESDEEDSETEGAMTWSDGDFEADSELHEHLSTNRLDAEKRQELRERGIVVREGKWTGLEDKKLKDNMKTICKKYQITDERRILYPNEYDNSSDVRKLIREEKLLMKLGKGIQRPFYNVYIRARKIFNSKNYLGKFSSEEVELLHELNRKHGTKWSKIGQEMGRSGQSLCDKFKIIRRPHATSTWTEEEKDKLVRVVKEVTGFNRDRNVERLYFKIPWTKVAERMKTRNVTQCRLQWVLFLSWAASEYTDRETSRNNAWNTDDNMRLIEMMYKLEVDSEQDVDWLALLDSFPSIPSPQKLSYFWHQLKVRYIPSHHFKSFEENIGLMYNTVLPQLREKNHGKRTNNLSTEFVNSDGEDSAHESDTDRMETTEQATQSAPKRTSQTGTGQTTERLTERTIERVAERRDLVHRRETEDRIETTGEKNSQEFHEGVINESGTRIKKKKKKRKHDNIDEGNEISSSSVVNEIGSEEEDRISVLRDERRSRERTEVSGEMQTESVENSVDEVQEEGRKKKRKKKKRKREENEFNKGSDITMVENGIREREDEGIEDGNELTEGRGVVEITEGYEEFQTENVDKSFVRVEEDGQKRDRQKKKKRKHQSESNDGSDIATDEYKMKSEVEGRKAKRDEAVKKRGVRERMEDIKEELETDQFYDGLMERDRKGEKRKKKKRHEKVEIHNVSDLARLDGERREGEERRNKEIVESGRAIERLEVIGEESQEESTQNSCDGLVGSDRSRERKKKKKRRHQNREESDEVLNVGMEENEMRTEESSEMSCHMNDSTNRRKKKKRKHLQNDIKDDSYVAFDENYLRRDDNLTETSNYQDSNVENTVEGTVHRKKKKKRKHQYNNENCDSSNVSTEENQHERECNLSKISNHRELICVENTVEDITRDRKKKKKKKHQHKTENKNDLNIEREERLNEEVGQHYSNVEEENALEEDRTVLNKKKKRKDKNKSIEDWSINAREENVLGTEDSLTETLEKRPEEDDCHRRKKRKL